METVTAGIIVNEQKPQLEFDAGIFGRALADPWDLDQENRNGTAEKREFVRGMQEGKIKGT